MESSANKYDAIVTIIVAALRLIASECDIVLQAGTGGLMAKIKGDVSTLLGCRLESVDVSVATLDGLPAVKVGAPFGNAQALLDDLIGKVTELGAGQVVGRKDGATFAATYKI